MPEDGTYINTKLSLCIAFCDTKMVFSERQFKVYVNIKKMIEKLYIYSANLSCIKQMNSKLLSIKL